MLGAGTSTLIWGHNPLFHSSCGHFLLISNPSRGRYELRASGVAGQLSGRTPRLGDRAAQDSVPLLPLGGSNSAPSPSPAALRGIVHAWLPTARSTPTKGRSRGEGRGHRGREDTGLETSDRAGTAAPHRASVRFPVRNWLWSLHTTRDLSLSLLSPVQLLTWRTLHHPRMCQPGDVGG